MPYADNDGAQTWYEVEGEGPPLVLLHGTFGSLEDWRTCGYVDALRTLRNLVLIDLRGHGRSSKPREAAAYDWPLLVGDVAGVMDNLGLASADVLGYSAGSYIALGLAMTRPQRVRTLILGGASPKWVTPPSAGLDFLVADLPAFIARTFRPDLPVPEEMRRRLLDNDAAAVRASLGATRCAPTPKMLRGFDKPCLVYVGEADPRLSESQEMASQLPGARLVTLPGISHLDGLLRSDLVLPYLREFLAHY